MNGRNRHNKYRKSVYRRHNIGIIVLISVISLAVLLTVFLVVGNLLHRQSEARNNETDTSDTENSVSEPLKSYPENITGHSVLLETTDSSFFSDRLDGLLEKGIREASVPLNTSDGTLLFNSSIADKIGYPTSGASVTLEKAVSAVSEKNMYISGIFYVNAFSNDDPLLRSVELSRSAAIISEVLNSGFDDVVIVAPHMTEKHIDEAIRFVEDIKALTESGSVGLTVSEDILGLEDSKKTSEIISLMDSRIDFLAIDMSGISSEDITAGINDKINSEKLYLHMYKMRVLLPYSADDGTLTEIISAAENNSIKNWQIIQ